MNTNLSTEQHPIVDGYLQDGYLFKANKLYILPTSVRDFLVWEVHASGLLGHFMSGKTIEEVERQFDWPSRKGRLQDN